MEGRLHCKSHHQCGYVLQVANLLGTLPNQDHHSTCIIYKTIVIHLVYCNSIILLKLCT